MTSDSLPVVDLSSLRVGAIRTACERHGFFYVSGHGVNPMRERRLEEATRRFFALPLAANLGDMLDRMTGCTG